MKDFAKSYYGASIDHFEADILFVAENLSDEPKIWRAG